MPETVGLDTVTEVSCKKGLPVSHYRYAWAKSKGLAEKAPDDGTPRKIEKDPTSYDTHVWTEIDPAASRSISQAVMPLQSSRRQGTRTQNVSPSFQILDRFPEYFKTTESRERLRRLLVTATKWNKSLGLDPCFARFCALVLAVVESERAAFRFIAVMYHRFRLDQCFAVEEAGATIESQVRAESSRIWYDTEIMFPDITKAFSKYGQKELFYTLTKNWLCSFLAVGYRSDQQSLEAFLPLVQTIFDASEKACEEDPRIGLRYIMVCILGRHRRSLSEAGSKAAFVEVVEKLMSHIPVEEGLLELIDVELLPRAVGVGCNIHAAAVAPATCATGWLVGVGAAHGLGPQLVGTAAFPAVGLGAGTLGMGLLGVSLGAVAAKFLGVQMGNEFIKEALEGITGMWDGEPDESQCGLRALTE
jgi:hypothetical protein